ncbi:MAG TPA: DUF4154 domain-containing protein [Thauera sp.]|uniref:YfiR family protein n=1 Tax=Thauera sp. 28 TaxID=303682 RepID=UPI0002D65596|nr:YfiR family protein [Thauera sp. 28]HAG76909.1 DUF4154 domain-containing protein [Thauera sp.]HAY11011.1 DUF4154 domain-containing protein [Thauera sp.]HNS92711.1 YfiR family protein [Thauera sp.]HRJ23520.1 YfiR family protein [Thauera sp.]HRK10604.1 YfiR family protein [Thauera sp.]
MPFRVRAVLLAALLSCVTAALPARAQTPAAAPEQALKAVLFYKLPLFTYRAPGVRHDTVLLCHLGRSPLEQTLVSLAEAPVEGLASKLRLLRSTHEARDCNFIFIARSEADRVAAVLAELNRPGLVTVSDIPGFARSGGMVELGVRERREGLSIIINRVASRKAGVEFMAQLLRLAEVIDE